MEHGEDDAYGALVRVDCGQKGAAMVRANKCLVVKMSHMAFCMWRPLSVGRTDSEMCVPRPNDARNERGEGVGRGVHFTLNMRQSHMNFITNEKVAKTARPEKRRERCERHEKRKERRRRKHSTYDK